VCKVLSAIQCVPLAVYSGENKEWSSSATSQLIKELEVRDPQDK
jgi:hypothetical protein